MNHLPCFGVAALRTFCGLLEDMFLILLRVVDVCSPCLLVLFRSGVRIIVRGLHVCKIDKAFDGGLEAILTFTVKRASFGDMLIFIRRRPLALLAQDHGSMQPDV